MSHHPGSASEPNAGQHLQLLDGDLPDLHDGADRASTDGQNQFIGTTRAKLTAAILAAALSAAIRPGPLEKTLAFAVGIAFLIVFVLEAWIWATNPVRAWYDGRALAESAKTMAWRYAVGAEPYPIQDETSTTRLVTDLGALLSDAPETELHPSSKDPISDGMRAVRASPLDQRRTIFLRDRINQQRSWYSNKASISRSRARQWRFGLLVTEAIGIAIAFARAFGATDIDLAGIAAALVGAGAAWLGIRQHETVSRAYAFASHELAIAGERLKAIDEEETWAKAVADAEEAISREHTMWRASRSSTA
ncbi:DUF4231 domain-containing protein [Terracoccus sp. 273MFTsu3.1]|uniref:DUF4231 domain-containing protein n=1 Tax=Terracoccus sp. 273MFTsu3.1 TaxID=1172188 RepID=UPI0009DC117E|nr:DUF4231 domain-containing protein [Terracoccus sp. 273MFTsu3.1]